MNKYTIYCTEEQAKKALELGAPIMIFGYGDLGDAEDKILKLNKQCVIKRNSDNSIIVSFLPTAEQMIGWLGTQGLCLDVEWSWNGQSTMWVWDNTEKERVYTSYGNSHKETTLAAIDAALDYLLKNKEE